MNNLGSMGFIIFTSHESKIHPLALNLRVFKMKAVMGFKAEFKAIVGQDKRSRWTVGQQTFLFISKSILNQ